MYICIYCVRICTTSRENANSCIVLLLCGTVTDRYTSPHAHQRDIRTHTRGQSHISHRHCASSFKRSKSISRRGDTVPRCFLNAAQKYPNYTLVLVCHSVSFCEKMPISNSCASERIRQRRMRETSFVQPGCEKKEKFQVEYIHI